MLACFFVGGRRGISIYIKCLLSKDVFLMSTTTYLLSGTTIPSLEGRVLGKQRGTQPQAPRGQCLVPVKTTTC